MNNFCACSRLYRFEASHYERMDSERHQTNAAVFGKAVDSHGHNYELTLNLYGEVDPKTGMVIELGQIDERIKKYIELLDHKNLSMLPHFNAGGQPITQEFIIRQIYSDLSKRIHIPHLQSVSLSESNGESKVFLHKDKIMKVYQTKTFTFNAQHALSSAALNATENINVFGKCIRPHGHDYTLDVCIFGSPNRQTNKLVVEHKLKEEIEKVLERFDYTDLNTLPEFSTLRPPTTENIVRVIYDLLIAVVEEFQSDKYSSDNVELAFLKLQETNRNSFLYFGDNFNQSHPSRVAAEAASI